MLWAPVGPPGLWAPGKIPRCPTLCPALLTIVLAHILCLLHSPILISASAQAEVIHHFFQRQANPGKFSSTNIVPGQPKKVSFFLLLSF